MNAFQYLLTLACGKPSQEECKTLNKLAIVGAVAVGALLGGLFIVFVR